MATATAPIDGTGCKIDKLNPANRTATVTKGGQTFKVIYAANGPAPKVGDSVDADLVFDAAGKVVKGYRRVKKP